VLRVLGELLKLDGFDFDNLATVRAEATARALGPSVSAARSVALPALDQLVRIADVPIYAGDAVLRRSSALNQTVHAQAEAEVGVHPQTALELGLADGDQALVGAGSAALRLRVNLDRRIAPGALRIAQGVAGAEALPHGVLEVSRA